MTNEPEGRSDVPPSWWALPAHLQKPFWTIAETCEATTYSRSTIDRLRDDPGSGFPRGRTPSSGPGKSRNKGKVVLPALLVLGFMEGRS